MTAAADCPPVNGQPPVLSTVQGVEPKPTAGTLAEVLSPSQANCFLECPAKWYFKYLRGLPDPKNGSLALGIAVDEALSQNFREKIRTHRDLPSEDVGELFSDSWEEQASETEFRDDEDADDLHDLGRELIDKYMREGAPLVQPMAVQVPVEGQIADVKVRGRIDVVDDQGVVIDLKTANRKPPGISADYRLQLTTYDLLCPYSRGRGRLDVMVKTKTIRIVQQTTTIGPSDVQYAESVYPMIQDSIRDGVFYPRRTSRLCSRKYCPFWRECEKEFGGSVE